MIHFTIATIIIVITILIFMVTVITIATIKHYYHYHSYYLALFEGEGSGHSFAFPVRAAEACFIVTVGFIHPRVQLPCFAPHVYSL